MSYAIPTTSLSGATVGSTGSVSWTNIAQSLGYPGPADIPHLALLNESPCGLQLQFVTGEQVVIPAGGWSTVALNPQCTGFSYQVLYVLNASPIVASLLGTWYAPGEVVPSTPVLGNSPIGGTLSGTTAQFLEGVGQSLTLSEKDISGVATIIPGASANIGMALAANDPSGTPQIAVQTIGGGGDPSTEVFGELIVFTHLGSKELAMENGQMVLYNTEATTAAGLPYIVAYAQDTAVTTTASATLCTYFLPSSSNGLLRLSGYVLLRNGVSGNSITFSYSYTDPGGSVRTGSFVLQGGGGTTNTLAATGTNSFSNTVWAGTPAFLSVKGQTTVTISYRDPTNSPNDLVSAIIERLN